MWDVIDTIIVFCWLGFLAWLAWMANRTILDLSGRLSKAERIRAWLLLTGACGVAAGVMVQVLVIQHFATGRP